MFFGEIFTGAIRIINPQWQLALQPTPFCTIAVSTGLGIRAYSDSSLDPNFAANHYVYVYLHSPEQPHL